MKKQRKRRINFCEKSLDHWQGNFGHWNIDSTRFRKCDKRHSLSITQLASIFQREIERVDFETIEKLQGKLPQCILYALRQITRNAFIVRECGWCGRFMGLKLRGPFSCEGGTTTGICSRCKKQILNEEYTTWSQSLPEVNGSQSTEFSPAKDSSVSK